MIGVTGDSVIGVIGNSITWITDMDGIDSPLSIIRDEVAGKYMFKL